MAAATTTQLNDAIFDACQFLQKRPERTLPDPPSIAKAKRASVAIVIAWSVDNDAQDYSFLSDRAPSLDQLRQQPWIRHAEPHILFIKRSKRQGDRWNNQ